MKKIFTLILLFLIPCIAFAQVDNKAPFYRIWGPTLINTDGYTALTDTGRFSLIIGNNGSGKAMILPRADTSGLPLKKGGFLYDTTDKAVFYCDGVSWKPIGGSIVDSLAKKMNIADSNRTVGYVTTHHMDSSITANVGIKRSLNGSAYNYVLNGRDEANYGTPGNNAVDLSHWDFPSSTIGATGDNSFASGTATTALGKFSAAFNSSNRAFGDKSSAFGYQNYANAYGSFVIGLYNDTLVSRETAWTVGSPVFIIGNGDPLPVNRHNAYVFYNTGNSIQNGNDTATAFVKKDGTATQVLLADGSTTPKLDSITDYVTPKYFKDSSGIVAVDEGNGIGYVVSNRNSANFGDIGLGAVDLSSSTHASSTTGATGTGSFAAGTFTTASGIYSFAAGNFTHAIGEYSFALGSSSSASGNYGFVVGNGATASGDYSIAIGHDSNASGDNSFASNSIASGDNSFAFGNGSIADGKNSFAAGSFIRIFGSYGSAFGNNLSSTAYSCFVIGQYNDSLVTRESAWTTGSPLFIAGNGTTSGNSNAYVLFNNGNSTQQGSVKTTQFILSDLNTAPSSSTDTGTKGEIRITADYIYVCTATDTWVRAALSTW